MLAIEGRRVSREAASDPPRLVRGLVLLSIPSDGDGERSLAEILKSQIGRASCRERVYSGV